MRNVTNASIPDICQAVYLMFQQKHIFLKYKSTLEKQTGSPTDTHAHKL